MSKAKWAAALGLGAVLGAVVSTIFKDKVTELVDEVLARAEELNPVLGQGREQVSEDLL